MQHLYWREGAVEKATGEKTLTLKQFEQKYDAEFLELAQDRYSTNLRVVMSHLEFDENDSQLKDDLIQALRWLDVNVNINWTLAHYKSAVRYLQTDPADMRLQGVQLVEIPSTKIPKAHFLPRVLERRRN